MSRPDWAKGAEWDGWTLVDDKYGDRVYRNIPLQRVGQVARIQVMIGQEYGRTFYCAVVETPHPMVKAVYESWATLWFKYQKDSPLDALAHANTFAQLIGGWELPDPEEVTR